MQQSQIQTVRRCEEPQMTSQMTSLGRVRTAVLPHGSRLKAHGWTLQPAASEAQNHVSLLIVIIWKISIVKTMNVKWCSFNVAHGKHTKPNSCGVDVHQSVHVVGTHKPGHKSCIKPSTTQPASTHICERIFWQYSEYYSSSSPKENSSCAKLTIL